MVCSLERRGRALSVSEAGQVGGTTMQYNFTNKEGQSRAGIIGYGALCCFDSCEQPLHPVSFNKIPGTQKSKGPGVLQKRFLANLSFVISLVALRILVSMEPL